MFPGFDRSTGNRFHLLLEHGTLVPVGKISTRPNCRFPAKFECGKGVGLCKISHVQLIKYVWETPVGT